MSYNLMSAKEPIDQPKDMVNGCLQSFSTLYKAPKLKHERSTYERVEKFISKHHFVDCNLYGRLYGDKLPVSLKHLSFGEKRVSFSYATEHLVSEGLPIHTGFEFGPTWSSHWFQVDIEIPSSWREKQIVLRFDAECEALLWNSSGRPVQGFSSDIGRTDVHLTAVPSKQRFYIEASANDRNGDGDGGAIRPVKHDKSFKLKLAEISVWNSGIYELYMDLEVLLDIASSLPKNNPRHYEALYLANDMINQLVKANYTPNAIFDCHRRAFSFFSQKNGHSQLTLYAVGNCHIDTAWLWKYDETRRKCARSWASAVALMAKHKKMTFAISQAQQLVWIKEDYPLLFEELQDLSAEGRLSGVGGAWVEFDGNLPSGESMIRQLLYGQREFQKLFGKVSRIFWLPDTFGYSAQLPQIMKHCNIDYFVTQKMSWSLVNKFPHHSFKWYGIDGTFVLAHFPPHHYVAQVTVKECLESAANFTDLGRSNVAMMLYGHGDGGGGPDEKMLERAGRLQDCDGVPRVLLATPEDFFKKLEGEVSNLCSWKGELYLELHNATYTTQACIKKMNRMLESILRDHEFLQSLQLLECGESKSLNAEWKQVLLNQFHDVLPGTCIREVVDDAMHIYEELLMNLTEKNANFLRFNDRSYEEGKNDAWVVNSSQWERTLFHNKMLLAVPPCSIWPLKELKPVESKIEQRNLITATEDFFVFTNKYFTTKVNKAGRLCSCVVHGPDSFGNLVDFDSIAVNKMGNTFVIFDDVPLFWDAWDVMDYHLETRQELTEVVSATILENSSLYGRLGVKIKISEKSHIDQEICVRADLPYLLFNLSVEWHESHKFLKVEFPVNVNSTDALYDIQYGYVRRPTHSNTSWDSARYEVCAHKWMVLAEYNRGVCLLNNCKYGHSCVGNIMRLSLLRASKSPDGIADMGQHQFSYGFFPFIGSFQSPARNSNINVVRAAWEFNNPIRFVNSWNYSKISSLFGIVGREGIIIDALKPAEDDRSALILRMFEAFGGGCQVRLLLKHGRIISVDVADGLERSVENLVIDPPIDGVTSSDSVLLQFRAFELKTLIIRLFEI